VTELPLPTLRPDDLIIEIVSIDSNVPLPPDGDGWTLLEYKNGCAIWQRQRAAHTV
jgi:hypothetical protein